MHSGSPEGGRKVWSVWYQWESGTERMTQQKSEKKTVRHSAKIFQKVELEKYWSTQWEMFALEAVRLLRCYCLRQRPGEAPALARPPTSSSSKPFDTALTATASAQSQNQYCQISAAVVFSCALCIWWTFKQIHRFTPEEPNDRDERRAHPLYLDLIQNSSSSDSLWVYEEQISDVCSHYGKR